MNKNMFNNPYYEFIRKCEHEFAENFTCRECGNLLEYSIDINSLRCDNCNFTHTDQKDILIFKGLSIKIDLYTQKALALS